MLMAARGGFPKALVQSLSGSAQYEGHDQTELAVSTQRFYLRLCSMLQLHE